MKLKICGMKYRNNIKAVAELQPDYLGFIFYRKSTRYFSGKIPKLPESTKKVGVFVNDSLSRIVLKIAKHGLDAIQLHGNESPKFCESFKKSEIIKGIERGVDFKHQFKVIKAFSIGSNFDFCQLKDYEEVCDYFLFDTKGKLPGGNGYTFDWSILQNYKLSKPYFLSGGIGLQESKKIEEFIKQPAAKYCHAIDVNSRFEIEPGEKKTELLKQFKNRLNQN